MKAFPAKNMQEINGILRKRKNWNGFIFRGQSLKEWKIIPSIFRAKIHEDADYSELISHHYDRYLVAARGIFDNLEMEDQDDIWALGQHNELHTPLLDWSASPYIALFFAFCEERSINISEVPKNIDEIRTRLNQDRTVFCLNAKIINSKFYEAIAEEFRKEDPKSFKQYVDENFDPTTPDLLIGKKIYKEDEIHLAEEVGDFELESLWENILSSVMQKRIKPHISKVGANKRMIAQNGLFTFLADPSDLETFIYKNYEDPDSIIYRIDISNSARDQVLNELSNMNINHKSLFPDAKGAGLYANYKYSIFSKKWPLDIDHWF